MVCLVVPTLVPLPCLAHRHHCRLIATITTWSDLVHNEALSDVLDLYDAFNMPSTMPASREDISRVIEGYVLQRLLGSTKITGSADLHDLERDIEENFLLWVDLKL